MNRAELTIKVSLFKRELAQLESIRICCSTCESYTATQCSRYESKPPPDVVAKGCDEWVYDAIPF